jgi:hypothetical protein
MSSQLVFAGAASGRHFVFAPPKSTILREPEACLKSPISRETLPEERKLPAFATGELSLATSETAAVFPALASYVPAASASPTPEPALPEPAFPQLPFLEPDFSDTEFPGPDLPEYEQPEPDLPTAVQRLPTLPKLSSVTAASHLDIRPAPMMASSGIASMDALTGGLPRGCLSEICGPSSSGRTSLMLSAIAAATRRQEACVLIDASDALDPKSLAATGVQLDRLLWVRCGAALESAPGHANGQAHPNRFEEKRSQDRTEFSALGNVLRVTDLLLQSSGFGLVAIDLGDVAPRIARRIPLTTWFRFRRAVEHTDTVLLVIAQQSCAVTCASLVLKFGGRRLSAVSSGKKPPAGSHTRKLSAVSRQLSEKTAVPTHGQILEGLQVEVELMRSRLERKPAQSESRFESRTVWQLSN